MRKVISFIAIGVYLTLTNYCLAYSLVTGEAHDPYKSSATQEKEPASHPGCHGHEEKTPSEKPSHDHQGQKDSEECCVTLTKSLESTVPSSIHANAPKLTFEKVLAPVPSAFIDLHLRKTWLSNHGPPGISASQGFLLLSPSRDPPSPLS